MTQEAVEATTTATTEASEGPSEAEQLSELMGDFLTPSGEVPAPSDAPVPPELRETVAEAQPAEDAPAEEEAAGPETDAETETAEAEATERVREVEPEEPAPTGWKGKMVARKEKQHDRRKQELEELTQSLLRPQLEQQAREIAELKGMLSQKSGFSVPQGSPQEQMRALAAAQGMSPDQYFQKLSAGVLGLEEATTEAGGGGEQNANRMLVAMQQQIAELKNQLQQVPQQWQQQQHQMQARQAIDSNIAAIVAIQSNPEAAKQYPYIAAVPPDVLADTARDCVITAVHNRPELLGSNELLTILDSGLKEQYEYMQARVGSVTPSSQPGEKTDEQGQGSPPGQATAPGKPGKPKARATSNKAARTVSGKADPLAAAGRVLEEAFFGED